MNDANLRRTIDLLHADHEHLYCVFSNIKNYFVVVDSNFDQFYSVDMITITNGLDARVHTGYRPYLFKNAEYAVGVADNFVAYNGKGKIEWKVMSAAEYYTLMQPRIEQIMKDLRQLLVKLED